MTHALLASSLVESFTADAEEASDYGFNIVGDECLIFKVKGLLVGCLSRNGIDTPGFRFDILGDSYQAWCLTTPDPNALILACRVNKLLGEMVRSTRMGFITKAQIKANLGAHLSYLHLGFKQV